MNDSAKIAPNAFKQITTITIVVLVGALVALAGGQSGAQFGSISVFMLCAIVAFGINWVAYVPSAIAKTETYYDLTGGISYLSVIAVAWVFSNNLDLRAQLAACMVVVWALRLSLFLFSRIRADGHDDRFDEIKVAPIRFLIAWTLQGLWVLLTAACALAIITTEHRQPIGIIGVIGIVLWVVGFVVEVVADAQKRQFKNNPANKGKYIDSGLWALSRHPNYFGEILLWFGMALLAVPVLSGWQYAVLISPVFVYLLLTRISGVPMLAEKAKSRWGEQAEFQAYLKRTRLLLPVPKF